MKNTNSIQRSFSDEIIEQVWEKARIIPGFDPEFLREDQYGSVIARVFYEECQPGYALGWKITYIQSPQKGGTDDISNLQPMQWQNLASGPKSKKTVLHHKKKSARKLVSKP